MDKQVRDFVTEKTRALLASATCCKEAAGRGYRVHR